LLKVECMVIDDYFDTNSRAEKSRLNHTGKASGTRVTPSATRLDDQCQPAASRRLRLFSRHANGVRAAG
jgi:hypothetical protein